MSAPVTGTSSRQSRYVVILKDTSRLIKLIRYVRSLEYVCFSFFTIKTMLYTVIHHYTLLYTSIIYYTLLYIIIHYYTSLYTIIHYYTLLYTIIHCYTLLYIIIH